MNALNWIEQSAFWAFSFSLLLGFFFSVRSFSLLQVAESGPALLLSFAPLRKLYQTYGRKVIHMLALLIALLIGAIVYILLTFTAQSALPLHLLMQTFLAWQIFCLKDQFAFLVKGQDMILQEGTVIGLDLLARPLYRPISETVLVKKYDRILRGYLEQLLLFWVIPSLLYCFSSLPLLFFYVSLIMQLEMTQEKAKPYCFLKNILYNLMITLLRVSFLLLPFDRQQKSKFTAQYLPYRDLFAGKKVVIKRHAATAEKPAAAEEERAKERETGAARKGDGTIDPEEIRLLTSLLTLFLGILFSIVLCLLYLRI